jgi:hypothetical protein
MKENVEFFIIKLEKEDDGIKCFKEEDNIKIDKHKKIENGKETEILKKTEKDKYIAIKLKKNRINHIAHNLHIYGDLECSNIRS